MAHTYTHRGRARSEAAIPAYPAAPDWLDGRKLPDLTGWELVFHTPSRDGFGRSAPKAVPATWEQLTSNLVSRWFDTPEQLFARLAAGGSVMCAVGYLTLRQAS